MTTRSRTAEASVVPVPRSGLELRHLRAFLALVEHGHITAAARALGLAQSTLSESLLGLERALGGPVVLRGRGARSGQATLTDAGRALLPHAREVLAAVDRAQAAVAQSTRTARGRISIVANESVSTYLLPWAAARFRGGRPNTQLSVSVDVCAGVRASVAGGAAHLGLLLGSGRDLPAARPRGSNAISRRIIGPALPVVAFAKPSHPLVQRGRRTVLTPDALAPYPLFVSDAAGDFHALIGRFVAGSRTHPARIESTGSVEGVKRALSEHPTAIGFLPAYAIAEERRAGAVAVLNIRPAPPVLRLEAWSSRSRESDPAIDELLDNLRESCERAMAGTLAEKLQP